MAVSKLKDGRWIVYYRRRDPNGKSRIKKEYFGRGADAEARARHRNDQLGLQKRRPPRETFGPSFAELAKAYAKNKPFSANSKKHLLIRLQANILPFLEAVPAIKIEDQTLDNYVAKRKKDGVKNSTIARELTDIKAILNWSARRRPPLIAFNPVSGYKKPAPDDAVILPPTLAELNRIIKTASPHLIRAIFLSHYIGLRPGSVELLSLTWDNVDLEAKTILIQSAKKGGMQKRLVPLDEHFIKIMNIWQKSDNNSGPIIHYRGRSVNSIKKAWKGALDRAKIKRRIRPYDIRHLFVTRALEAGADIKALSEIVGSKPQTLIKHYQHVTAQMHRKIISSVPRLKPPLKLVQK